MLSAWHNMYYDAASKKNFDSDEKAKAAIGTAAVCELVLLFTSFFTVALACQRFFHPFLFARLEVKGMTLHFLNDVLLLDFTLEAPQGVLEGFTLLNANFRQTGNTPNLVPNGQ